MVTDDTKVIRKARELRERYNLTANTLYLPMVTFRRTENNIESKTFEAVVDRHGKVHWFDEKGARLPKSIGWILREFASN